MPYGWATGVYLLQNWDEGCSCSPAGVSCFKINSARIWRELVCVFCSSTSIYPRQSWCPAEGAWKAESWLFSGLSAEKMHRRVHSMHKSGPFCRCSSDQRKMFRTRLFKRFSVHDAPFAGPVSEWLAISSFKQAWSKMVSPEPLPDFSSLPAYPPFFCLSSWRCSVCAWNRKINTAYRSYRLTRWQREHSFWSRAGRDGWRRCFRSILIQAREARASRWAASYTCKAPEDRSTAKTL